MKFFVHVGMPKCASTSIQAYFSQRYRANCALGLLYPKSCRGEGGAVWHGPLLQSQSSAQSLIDEVVEEADSLNCDKVFLSAELFMSLADRPRVNEFYEALHSKVGTENVSTVFLIRDPIDMLTSSVQQFVRGPFWNLDRRGYFSRLKRSGNDDHQETLSDAYISLFHKRWGCNWYCYDELIKNLQENGKFEKFFVLRIDEPDTDILQQLRNLLDVTLPKMESRKLNQSSSTQQLLFFLDFINKYGISTFDANRRRLRQIEIPEEASPSNANGNLELFVPDSVLKERYSDMYERLEVTSSMGWSVPQ